MLARRLIHLTRLCSKEFEVVGALPTVSLKPVDNETECVHEPAKVPRGIRLLVRSPIGLMGPKEMSLSDASSPKGSQGIERSDSGQEKVRHLDPQLPSVN